MFDRLKKIAVKLTVLACARYHIKRINRRNTLFCALGQRGTGGRVEHA